MTPHHALADREQEAEIDRQERRATNETERHLESELQTTSPPLSIAIIITSASALAHCHHVNTRYCTLITGPQTSATQANANADRHSQALICTHARTRRQKHIHTHTHTDMCGASCTICLSHWSIMAMSYNGAGLMNSGGVKFWGWSRHGACVLIPSHGSFTSAVCVCVCKTSVSHSCHF